MAVFPTHPLVGEDIDDSFQYVYEDILAESYDLKHEQNFSRQLQGWAEMISYFREAFRDCSTRDFKTVPIIGDRVRNKKG